MNNLHRLLKRQLHNCLKNTEPNSELESFINAINESYMTYDKERLLLERSIDISSREYNENMQKIRTLHSQLVQQEKMAGIGQLSAGVAHEINNPLGYTQSNLETLKKYLEKIKTFLDTLTTLENDTKTNPDNIAIEQLWQMIQKSMADNKINLIIDDLDDIIDESVVGLNRIEKIVKSLLGFSRASSMEFEDYDLNKGIEDTLAVAHNEIKYTTKVIKELGKIPYIRAAGGTINQVLLNLIVNAVHAIKGTAHEGILTIKTYKKNNFIYCSVTDNGTGIAKENLNSIFTPFFTTKPVGVGTGLGLSIAYDIIVNKHHGKINAESELGKGTTFIISLPIKEGKEVAS